MTSSPSFGDQYPPGILDAVGILADTIVHQGHPKAYEASELYADLYNGDRGAFAVAAARALLESTDPNKHPSGVEYLRYEAEEHPDTKLAENMAHDAAELTRSPEERRVAHELISAALLHFRSVAMQGDPDSFMPEIKYIEDFTRVLESANMAGFDEEYTHALQFITGIALRAARNPEFDDIDQLQVGELLSHIALGLREQVPEAAMAAEKAIVSPHKRQVLETELFNRTTTELLYAGRFDDAVKQLTGSEGIIDHIWEHMPERLLQAQPGEAREWGNNVIKAILTARPDYFRKICMVEEDNEVASILLSGELGVVLGLLNHRQSIKDIILPNDEVYPLPIPTLKGIAYGLGMNNDVAGLHSLQELLKARGNKTEEWHLAGVASEFDTGRAEAQQWSNGPFPSAY